MGNVFGYYINLDERGEFFADVRDSQGETVYEIHGFDVFETGYLKHKNDLAGLQEMLVDFGVINSRDEVLPMAEFESLLDDEDSPAFNHF